MEGDTIYLLYPDCLDELGAFTKEQYDYTVNRIRRRSMSDQTKEELDQEVVEKNKPIEEVELDDENNDEGDDDDDDDGDDEDADDVDD